MTTDPMTCSEAEARVALVAAIEERETARESLENMIQWRKWLAKEMRESQQALARMEASRDHWRLIAESYEAIKQHGAL